MIHRDRPRVIGLVILASFLVSCTPESSGPPETTDRGSAQAPAAPGAGRIDVEQLGEPLLVWAEAKPEDGVAPLAVTFTAETEGGTPPLRLTWVFGDAMPDSHDRNPIHTYAAPGSYRAELRVADASGDADSDWVEVTVTPTPSPAPPPAH